MKTSKTHKRNSVHTPLITRKIRNRKEIPPLIRRKIWNRKEIPPLITRKIRNKKNKLKKQGHPVYILLILIPKTKHNMYPGPGSLSFLSLRLFRISSLKPPLSGPSGSSTNLVCVNFLWGFSIVQNPSFNTRVSSNPRRVSRSNWFAD